MEKDSKKLVKEGELNREIDCIVSPFILSGYSDRDYYSLDKDKFLYIEQDKFILSRINYLKKFIDKLNSENKEKKSNLSEDKKILLCPKHVSAFLFSMISMDYHKKCPLAADGLFKSVTESLPYYKPTPSFYAKKMGLRNISYDVVSFSPELKKEASGVRKGYKYFFAILNDGSRSMQYYSDDLHQSCLNCRGFSKGRKHLLTEYIKADKEANDLKEELNDLKEELNDLKKKVVISEYSSCNIL